MIEYFRARELVTSVYLECWRNVTLENGEGVSALVYRVDQTSPQYTHRISLDKQVEIVRNAEGGSGKNTDYVASTVAAMLREGIRDHSLEYVDQKLKSIDGNKEV